MSFQTKKSSILAAMLAVLAIAPLALGGGTVVTYQGLLQDSGANVDGPVDFEYRLFDAEVGGSQVGVTVMIMENVVDGIFTSSIDFGVDPYTSDQTLWLEVTADTQVLARKEITAAPFSLATRGISVDAAGNVGIGTTTPTTMLQVVNPVGNPDVRFDTLGDNSITRSNTLKFGHSNGSGARIQCTRSAGDDFGMNMKFATQPVSGGSLETRMRITTDGKVAIGPNTPSAMLDVDFSTSTLTTDIGVKSTVDQGFGVYSEATASTGTAIGVYGQAVNSNTSAWGVFSNGRFGASGTKSFCIDHPLDPEGAYLFHYSSESPEPQNRYNGNVTLDANGSAVVQLPDYFESINSNIRYGLTAIGGPAPDLHVAKEVENNQFLVAGGKPNQKVSWEITATRNDAFVKVRGAPVELQKLGAERGKYLTPELYGKPADMGIHYRQPATTQVR